MFTSCSSKSWREASRESTGIAPKAIDLKEDFVQVYYARAFSWRGYLGIHPWIAWKKKEEQHRREIALLRYEISLSSMRYESHNTHTNASTNVTSISKKAKKNKAKNDKTIDRQHQLVKKIFSSKEWRNTNKFKFK